MSTAAAGPSPDPKRPPFTDASPAQITGSDISPDEPLAQTKARLGQ